MLNPAETRPITLDELEQIDDKRVEIIEGELVEMIAASGLHHKEIEQYISGKDGVIQVYKSGDVMDVSALFPDLELKVDAIFEMPQWVKN